VSLLFSLSCWKETEEYHGHALGLMRDVGHGQRQPSSRSEPTAKRLRRTYGQSIRRKAEILIRTNFETQNYGCEPAVVLATTGRYLDCGILRVTSRSIDSARRLDGSSWRRCNLQTILWSVQYLCNLSTYLVLDCLCFACSRRWVWETIGEFRDPKSMTSCQSTNNAR
jgi:hypothetical protein